MLEKARILVRVQPNASRNEVIGFKDDILHMRITSPPVKGKANQEMIKFLSGILKISKRSLTIEKGVTSKKKIIGINGLTQKQVIEQLEKLPM